MNETMLLAASAARFEIPVILVTGDDVLHQEVAAFSPETEYVIVKQAISRRQAEPRGRDEVSADIQAAARRAIERLSSIPPWNPPALSGSIENFFSYTLSVMQHSL